MFPIYVKLCEARTHQFKIAFGGDYDTEITSIGALVGAAHGQEFLYYRVRGVPVRERRI